MNTEQLRSPIAHHPYPPQLTAERDEHIHRLQAGDRAYHIMNFAGVHPGDIGDHEAIRDHGMPFKPGIFHQEIVIPATARGATIAWLRVLPEVGTPRYDNSLDHPAVHTDADIDAMMQLMRGIAATGQEVHTLVLDQDLRNRMEAYCWGAEPLVKSYLAGMRDNNPQKALWSTHRRLYNGLEVLDFLGVGDYRDRQFAGYEVYVSQQSPAGLPKGLINWLAFWLEEYHQHAQPLPS